MSDDVPPPSPSVVRVLCEHLLQRNDCCEEGGPCPLSRYFPPEKGGGESFRQVEQVFGVDLLKKILKLDDEKKRDSAISSLIDEASLHMALQNGMNSIAEKALRRQQMLDMVTPLGHFQSDFYRKWLMRMDFPEKLFLHAAYNSYDHHDDKPALLSMAERLYHDTIREEEAITREMMIIMDNNNHNNIA